MRPSKLQNYMDMASTCAERSHDAETQVGALLINNKSGAIIATGYNGFIKGADDSILPNTRPEKYEYILHAEMNLLSNCARHGISMDDCFLVCTLSPCKLCMRLMFNSGVERVICKDLYRDWTEITNMKDVDVGMSLTPEGFHEIHYGAAVHKR